MAAGDVIEVAYNARFLGQPCVTKFHILLVDGTYSEGDLAANLNTNPGPIANFVTHLTQQYIMDEYTTRKVYPSKGTTTAWTPVIAVGGLAATQVAPQLAVLFSLRTGVGGRRNRGRLYYPYCYADPFAIQQGLWTTAALNNATEGVAFYMMGRYGPIGTLAAHLRWTIYSRRSDGHTEIADYQLHNEIATQRRRSLITKHR